MPKTIISALLGCLFLSLTGCQSLPHTVYTLDPRTHPDQKAYEGAIAPYIIESKIYDGPATGIRIIVLPLNEKVRTAQVMRQAAAHSLNTKDTEAMLSQERAEAAQGLEIMVSVYTPDTIDSQFNERLPSWRVFLEMPDGGQVDLIDVRQIKFRERNSMLEALYPFWGYWDHLYRLRFPLVATDKQVFIVFSGPQGKDHVPLILD
jgi:hypothetical protein